MWCDDDRKLETSKNLRERKSTASFRFSREPYANNTTRASNACESRVWHCGSIVGRKDFITQKLQSCRVWLVLSSNVPPGRWPVCYECRRISLPNWFGASGSHAIRHPTRVQLNSLELKSLSMTKKLTFIDLFAGAGGLSEGLMNNTFLTTSKSSFNVL